MELQPTSLDDLWLIHPERHVDERGFFARTYDRSVFKSRGLALEPTQCSVSFNHSRFTLRGLHYQEAPHGESKLVRCSRGSIFDVAVDMRPGSRTYGQWASAELSDDNRVGLFIPKGFAHGFLTLTDNCEVSYVISDSYNPSAGRGVRWDDPGLSIRWPSSPKVISERDASYEDFRW